MPKQSVRKYSGTSDNGHSEEWTQTVHPLPRYCPCISTTTSEQWTMDKMLVSNVSIIRRFHCTDDYLSWTKCHQFPLKNCGQLNVNRHICGINCKYSVSVRQMCDSGKLGAAGIQEVLLLRSTSLLRKYSSFIDSAWISLFHRYLQWNL